MVLLAGHRPASTQALGCSVGLAGPAVGGEVVEDVDDAAVFEEQAPVGAGDGFVAPPFVVDAPGLEGGLDGESAAREVDGCGDAAGVRLDAGGTGAVEWTEAGVSVGGLHAVVSRREVSKSGWKGSR